MKQMQIINTVAGSLEVKGWQALEDGRNPFEMHDKLHALKGKSLVVDFETSVTTRAISALSCGGALQDGSTHGVCTFLDFKS